MKIQTTIRNYKIYFLLIGTFFILSSCGSNKDDIYFQDIDISSASKSRVNYNTPIKSDDMLTISVSALDQIAVRPFNLPVATFTGTSGVIGREVLQNYLVDRKGNIDFPVLGTIKLAGLNRIQATTLLKDMLKEYIKDPIVVLRIINFKVTVIGEVARPGSFTIPNERITILEAIGLAGDLTIHAKRNNILVVREKQGKKTYIKVDMTSADVFNSSGYYLEQNDLVYVVPNKSKVKSSTVTPSTFATLTAISVILSTIGTVVLVNSLIK